VLLLFVQPSRANTVDRGQVPAVMKEGEHSHLAAVQEEGARSSRGEGSSDLDSSSSLFTTPAASLHPDLFSRSSAGSLEGSDIEDSHFKTPPSTGQRAHNIDTGTAAERVGLGWAVEALPSNAAVQPDQALEEEPGGVERVGS